MRPLHQPLLFYAKMIVVPCSLAFVYPVYNGVFKAMPATGR